MGLRYPDDFLPKKSFELRYRMRDSELSLICSLSFWALFLRTKPSPVWQGLPAACKTEVRYDDNV
jgi:hypothetical protein